MTPNVCLLEIRTGTFDTGHPTFRKADLQRKAQGPALAGPLERLVMHYLFSIYPQQLSK